MLPLRHAAEIRYPVSQNLAVQVNDEVGIRLAA